MSAPGGKLGCRGRRHSFELGGIKNTIMIEYIIDNKEWLFGGVGVTLIAWVLKGLKKPKSSKMNKSIIRGKRNTVIQQNKDSNLNISDLEGDENRVDQK